MDWGGGPGEPRVGVPPAGGKGAEPQGERAKRARSSSGLPRTRRAHSTAVLGVAYSDGPLVWREYPGCEMASPSATLYTTFT